MSAQAALAADTPGEGRPPRTAVPLVGANGRAPGTVTRQVVRVTGLGDLEAITGEIELIRPGDGALLRVPYRSLTQAELTAQRASIKWPEPPKRMVPGARGSRPQMIEDREDPAYIAAAQEAAEQLGYRIVAKCLIGGGVAIPGDTEEEQVAEARVRLGSWAFMALGQVLQGLHNVTEEDVRLAAKN